MKLFSFICAAVACVGYANATRKYSIDVVQKKSSGWGTEKVCTITTSEKLTFNGFTKKLIGKDCLKFDTKEVGDCDWSIKGGHVYNTATGKFSNQVVTVSNSVVNYIPNSLSSNIKYSLLVNKATFVVSFECKDGTYKGSNCKCKKCDVSCKTCSGKSKCDTCKKHSYKKDGLCVCEKGYVRNLFNGECEKVKDPVVVKTCSEGFYLDGINCKPCKNNCKKCKSYNTCLKCKEGSKFDYYLKKCVCKDGYKEDKNGVCVKKTEVTCKCNCDSYDYFVKYYGMLRYFDWEKHHHDYKDVYKCDKHRNCKKFFKCRGDKECSSTLDKCHRRGNCASKFPKGLFDHCSKKGRCHEIFGCDKHHKYIGGFSVIAKNCKKRCSCSEVKKNFTYKNEHEFSWNYFLNGCN